MREDNYEVYINKNILIRNTIVVCVIIGECRLFPVGQSTHEYTQEPLKKLVGIPKHSCNSK